jgi:hypothetical protein
VYTSERGLAQIRLECVYCFDMMMDGLAIFCYFLVRVGSIWACTSITKRKMKQKGPLKSENVANVRKVIRPTKTIEIAGGPNPGPDRHRQRRRGIEGAVLNFLTP